MIRSVQLWAVSDERTDDLERRVDAAERRIQQLNVAVDRIVAIVDEHHTPTLDEHGDKLRVHSETLDSHAVQLRAIDQIRMDLNRLTDAVSANNLTHEHVLRRVDTLLCKLPDYFTRIEDRFAALAAR